MKIAVTGSEGRLGSWLVNKYGFTPLNCDVTKPEEVKHFIKSISPDVIIHTAAMTNVAQCEENPQKAFTVNVEGTKNIVDNFTRGLLIYISTVHVFDGNKQALYTETSKPSPLNRYGWTKWIGEEMAKFGTHQTIIVRTSKLFDLSYLAPGMKLLQNGEPQDYPAFIHRSFIYVPHFIDELMKLIELHETAPSIVNIAGGLSFSYYNFWDAIANEFGYNRGLILARTIDNGDVARPKNGGLSTKLAESTGLPVYSALDGIKAIKEIM